MKDINIITRRLCVTKSENIPAFLMVGDTVLLRYGYSATCQKITKKKATFLLDQVLYEAKDRYECIDYLKEVFEEENGIFNPIKDLMVPFKNGSHLRLPYAEEIFGDVDWLKKRDKLQWPPMKSRKNRMGVDINGNGCWYWLKNRTKSNGLNFGCSNLSGYPDTREGCEADYIRPVFKIKLK